MASGRELAKQNLECFERWCGSKTDEDFKQLVYRGCLNKKEIAQECGFARSAVDQNPAIRRRLTSLEEELRNRGILPQLATNEAATIKSVRSSDVNLERLRRLEIENAQLRAEVTELKRKLVAFTSLSDILAETGRLPR